MAKSKGSKLYAVAKGRVPGVYNTWSECQAQTSGFGGAIFKSFKTPNEAQSFMQANNSSSTSSSASIAASSASSSRTSSSKDNGRKRSRENKVDTQRKKQQQNQSSTSNARLQITIYFDGGSRGNPGVAGAGAEVAVVYNSTTNATSSTTKTYSVREYCGTKETNNYAEYKGLLAGLKQAKLCIEQASLEQPLATMTVPLFQLQIYGDSNLIIQQLKGNWQCHHPKLKILFDQSREMIGAMKTIDPKSEVLYDHVYREHNKVADALANEAMDRCESWITSTGNGNNSGDEKKAPAVAVAVTTKSVAKRNNNHPAALSNQEVIDVDDSDNESHYSV